MLWNTDIIKKHNDVVEKESNKDLSEIDHNEIIKSCEIIIQSAEILQKMSSLYLKGEGSN